jgi:hypothetical protein
LSLMMISALKADDLADSTKEARHFFVSSHPL